MAEAARLLRFDAPNGYGREPDEHCRLKGKGRAIAVAKFRELADRLESGELDGARVQWRDTHECLVEVVVDGERQVFDLLDEKGSQPPSGARQQPISGLEFMTRTAWTETGEGTVALKAITIEETR